MHVTIATVGSRGDVEPALALALEFKRRGDDVAFVGPAEFREDLERRGLDYHALAPAIPELETPTERESLATRIRKFRATRRHLIRQFDRVVEASRGTDLLLASITFVPAALTARDVHGTPTGLFNVAVPFVRTAAYPNPWIPALPLGRWANRLSYVLFEQVLWQTVRGPVNRWRRQRYGLRNFPPFGFFKRVYDEQVPLLLAWSRLVYPPADDFPPSVRVTGRWFMPREESYRPPDRVARFLDSVQAPVCITFGSNPISDHERVLEALLGGLRATGRKGILVRASSGLGAGADLADTLIAVDTIPFSWLFQRLALVVHHGGCGVAACAVEAGVPSVVVPTRPDQLALGRRLSALGVAPPPIPLRGLSAARMARAIRAVAEAPSMAATAQQLASRVRLEDGVTDAADYLHAFVASRDRSAGGALAGRGPQRPEQAATE